MQSINNAGTKLIVEINDASVLMDFWFLSHVYNVLEYSFVTIQLPEEELYADLAMMMTRPNFEKK